MVKNNVVVLLAAYNGANTISQQLDTILQQINVNVHIICSVDFSSDDSFNICLTYAERYQNISVLPYGERFGGAGKNFYRLIHDTKLDSYDFIAFSDQDDIWPENKLSKAIESLQLFDCYSSNVTAFWEDGHEALIDKAQPQLQWDFLFEAAGPGCTYVLKRDVAIKFKELLLEKYQQVGNDIVLHDWLIYAFARSRNYSWFIDSEPMMRYRQHANNQVGTNDNFFAAWKRFKLIKAKWYSHQVMKIADVIGLQNIDIYKSGLNGGYKGNIFLLLRVCQLRRRLRDRFALSLVLVLNFF